jgi:hypothetical protein
VAFVVGPFAATAPVEVEGRGMGTAEGSDRGLVDAMKARARTCEHGAADLQWGGDTVRHSITGCGRPHTASRLQSRPLKRRSFW